MVELGGPGRIMLAVLGTLGAVGLTACQPGRTGVVLSLITDQSSPDGIDAVAITVTAPGFEYTNVGNPWSLGPDALDELPGTISFYVDGNQAVPLTITAAGFRGGLTPIISRTASLTLVEGQTLLLRMALTGSCAGAPGDGGATSFCPDGLTCIEGTCRSPALDGTELPRYSPELESLIGCQSGSVFLSTRTNRPLPVEGGCDGELLCREGACLRTLALVDFDGGVDGPDGGDGTDDGRPGDAGGDGSADLDGGDSGCLRCPRPDCEICVLKELRVAGLGPWTFVIGPDDNLWYTDGDNQVGRVGADGVPVEFRIPTPFVNPTAMVAGPDGALWFAESNGVGIGRATIDGQVTELRPPPPPNGFAATPTGIATGPDGNLWFTDLNGNQVVRLDPVTMSFTGSFDVPTTQAYPGAIVAGADGNLWFTEYNVGKIGRITPAGVITEFTIPTTGTLPVPGRLVLGPDGNIWFTEGAANQVGRITPDGQITEFLVSNISGSSSNPVIVAGPDGHLWYNRNEELVRVALDGSHQNFYFPYIGDIIWGPDGRLWASDNQGTLVQVEVRY